MFREPIAKMRTSIGLPRARLLSVECIGQGLLHRRIVCTLAPSSYTVIFCLPDALRLNAWGSYTRSNPSV
jgi:hypothetical protein